MKQKNFIYSLNYETREEDLVGLEMRALFKQNPKRKLLASTLDLRPSISAFIKSKLQVLYRDQDFDKLLAWVKASQIKDQDFLIKYIQHPYEDLGFKAHRAACKAIGLEMLGYPSFEAPKVVYGLLYDEGLWYFGYLTDNDNGWTKHRTKPRSYSSAINNRVAKAIANIASQGQTSVKMIDPCCGVATVLLEAHYSAYKIVGRELNSKIANDARYNLKHFSYDVPVETGGIEAIEEEYDVAIVDLPYGILSRFDIDQQNMIIGHARRIAKRILLVSSVDIRDRLEVLDLKLLDHCKIVKSVKREFTRYIWLCQR